MLRKKKERNVAPGFIGGALPNEKYTDDDLIMVRVLMDGLVFIVMIYIYTEKQKYDTQVLVSNFKNGGFDTEAVCRWCIMHGLKFKVVTELVRWKFWKVLLYLHLRFAVKKYERQYQGNFIYEDGEGEEN